MNLGQPSVDHIILRDEHHRAMMERGSRRLVDAIGNYRRGWVSKASNDDVLWLTETPVGTFIREAASEAERQVVDRALCGRCGVRADRHHEGGCHSYKRTRTA